MTRCLISPVARKRSERYIPGRYWSSGHFIMSQLFNYIYVIGAVVFLFGAAVFVHEFGHYWMARRRGLKVEAFAIGFGPKIFGWTRDGIDYSWRWIPAGGFVKLPQMVTSEMLEGSKSGEGGSLPPISPWSKILVAFAGPFMNVVFACAIAIVIYFVGLPVLINPSIIGYVEPDSAEAKLGIRPGDRIVEVNGKRVKSWQDIQMGTVLARTNMLPVVIERVGARKTFLLEAKSNELIGGKFLNLDPRTTLKSWRSNRRRAEKAGLKAKDVILSFASVPIASREQLIDLIKKRAGQPSEIRVERSQEKLT